MLSAVRAELSLVHFPKVLGENPRATERHVARAEEAFVLIDRPIRHRIVRLRVSSGVMELHLDTAEVAKVAVSTLQPFRGRVRNAMGRSVRLSNLAHAVRRFDRAVRVVMHDKRRGLRRAGSPVVTA